MIKITIALGVLLFSIAGELQGAVLDRYRGQLTLNGKASPSKGTKLKKRDRLVASGKGSFFVVKYDDGSRFLVKEGDLIIEKLKKKSSELSLQKGTILSFVQPRQSRTLTINTRTASLGVRGTKFWASESPEETYLCVCEGSVEVNNKNGSLLVSANEDLRVKSQDQKLKKSLANDFMWNMAVDGFKELGFTIPRR